MSEIERYNGLTTADKGALLDAKAKGYLYVIYRENEPLAFWRTSPDRLDSIIGYDMIDIALAQIAEMESNEKALLSEKAIEKGCMTGKEQTNERVHQTRRCCTQDRKDEGILRFRRRFQND